MNKKLVVGIILGVIVGILLCNFEIMKLLALYNIIPYGTYLWIFRMYQPLLTVMGYIFSLKNTWDALRFGLIMKSVLVGCLGGLLWNKTRNMYLGGLVLGCIMVFAVLMLMMGVYA